MLDGFGWLLDVTFERLVPLLLVLALLLSFLLLFSLLLLLRLRSSLLDLFFFFLSRLSPGGLSPERYLLRAFESSAIFHTSSLMLSMFSSSVSWRASN